MSLFSSADQITSFSGENQLGKILMRVREVSFRSNVGRI